MRLNFLSRGISIVVVMMMALLAGGCDEAAQPLTPTSLDQIPAEFEKAFASATGQAKELSDLVVTAVQGKEFPKASMALDALARRTDLNKIQTRTIAGAFMSVNAVLREAESKGDPRAIEILKHQRNTK